MKEIGFMNKDFVYYAEEIQNDEMKQTALDFYIFLQANYRYLLF